MAFELTSSVLSSEKTIPRRYTCEGAGVSPSLAWSEAPEGTRGFALICEDPDAPGGTFAHWLLYNIPPARSELPENVPPDPTLPWGAAQGRNDFGNVGYGGPCPPMGSTHRFYFRLYALDEQLDLPPGISRNQLLREVEKHAIARTGLMGRYGRP
jgi:Raf kinase inhibitor-like YbhB/YbcL family protein